jgi:hypothetical protein
LPWLKYIAVALLAGSLIVSACGSTPADESCGTFESQGSSSQQAVVAKLVETHGTTDPSPAEIDTAWVSAKAYCLLHGSNDMISGIYS